ncbi:MAG TPA: M48 family metallopeptidase [Methylotenera sp.]|nr:M48 family metallopeptidase [Methylotenera sp.]
MQNPIQVSLFSSTLPISGIPALCELEQDALLIQSHDSSTYQPIHQRIKLTELSAKIAGFDHDQLQLSWLNEGAKWSLMPQDKAAQKALLKGLTKGSVSGLLQWHYATRSQSAVWKGILYTFGLISISVILIVWQHDRVTSWAANQVSMKTEKRLGDSVLQSLNPEANFLKDGAALQAVKAIGQQLTAGSKYQYQWYVSKDLSVNAFAIPGGIIVVNSGLLKKADSPNELAAVLAHEVQHVEQKHALKNMMNSAGIAAIVLVVLGDANAVIMLMAHQVSAQYFSRQIESDADMKGLQLLQKKNIDTGGMVSFFKKMQPELNDKAEKNTGKNTEKKDTKAKSEKDEKNTSSDVSSWFSSHPDTLNRIQAIERYLATHPCLTCKSLVWDKTLIANDIKQQRTADRNRDVDVDEMLE